MGNGGGQCAHRRQPRHAGEFRLRLLQCFLCMLRANRRGYVGGGAPITEETSLRIKNGFAAYGNVEHRAVPAGGPVPEVVKWLVRLEGRDVTAPLLRLLLEVGGEIPSRRADPERGGDANSAELLGWPHETGSLPALPQPIQTPL